MPSIPDHTFTDLIDAIARIRGFFDTNGQAERLTPADIRTLEQLLEVYQRADETFGARLEQLIKQSAPKPRR